MKRPKILLMAGTYEGRKIAKFFSENNIPIWVSVATDYGKELLEGLENINVTCQRLTQNEMQSFVEKHNFNLIIDATHPYALQVGENIRTTVENLKIPYLRILREEFYHKDVLFLNNHQETVEFLKNNVGNALLTIGSKELKHYTLLENYNSRLYIRVLADENVLKQCRNLGFSGSQIIAMQGPFSKELNAVMLKDFKCNFLISKDGGQSGGIKEKFEATQEVGAKLILIKRPFKEEGLVLSQALKYLENFIN